MDVLCIICPVVLLAVFVPAGIFDLAMWRYYREKKRVMLEAVRKQKCGDAC